MKHTIFSTLLVLALMTGCIQMPTTAEHDASIPQITFHGHSFHYEVQGQRNKPLVIVLHGGPGADSRYMAPLMALADDYQVVRYDQLGTGLSERVPTTEIDIDSFVRDLHAFVEHFGNGEPVHLVGHSWGAMLASLYAGRYPEKVSGLVLAEPGFIEYKQMKAMQAEAGGPSLKMVVGMSAAWVKKWFATGDKYAKEDYFIQQLIPMFQAPSELCGGELPPLEMWRFGSSNFEATILKTMKDETFAKTLHFAEGMDQFETPVLMLTGGCNQLTGYDYQKQFLAYYPNVTLNVVPEAGHFMFNDQPEMSLTLVRNYFESL